MSPSAHAQGGSAPAAGQGQDAADDAREDADDGLNGPPGCLAIVAGSGALPKQVAEARRAAGLPYLVVVFEGAEAAWMSDHPRQYHRFERVGALFAGLAEAGAEAVTFAGAMQRPRLRPWRLDWAALTLLVRALRLLAMGDDAMLRGFAAIFERRGLTLIGAQEVLGESAQHGIVAHGQQPQRPDQQRQRRPVEP
ncbi:MAG: hypothetical protein AAF968_27620, partial [Pseudomonadota bacterium]